jgi:hypothetical protein
MHRPFASLLSLLLCSTACVHRVAPVAPATRPLSDDERAAIVSAGTRLFELAEGPVAVCVAIGDSLTTYEPELTVLRELGPRAKLMRDCPPTYESMIYNPNVKRPRGYVDPYKLELRWPTLTSNAATLVATLWQGTGFVSYRCDIIRGSPAWRASCTLTGRGVS